MAKRMKGENIADGFLILSQIAFFTAIIINYSTDTLFPEGVFIGVASFLLGISIVTMIIKMILKRRS